MQRWYRKLLADIPKIVGNEAVNFFRERFHEQGWHDVAEEPWEPLSPNTKKKKGGAILIESGKLMRSIHIESMSGLKVTVVASMPYAKVHNEGFEGEVTIKSHARVIRRRTRVASSSIATKRRSTSNQMLTYGTGRVKEHQRKMRIKARRFMGVSQELNLRIKMRILKHSQQLWKTI